VILCSNGELVTMTTQNIISIGQLSLMIIVILY
jgi:hypothetical protein